MKRILLLILNVWLINVLHAQYHNLDIQIINQKDKPYKDASILQKNIFGSKEVDPNGKCSLQVLGSDTVYVAFNHYNKAIVPVENRTIIVIKIDKKNASLIEGQETKKLEVVTIPKINLSDLQNADLSMFKGLEDFLTSKYVKLYIDESGEMFIQSATSVGGIVPSVIILNGKKVSDFNQLKQLTSLSEIKSISIKQENSIYGSERIGGIIDIKSIDQFPK